MRIYTTFIILCIAILTSNAQTLMNQDFESLDKGTNILELEKGSFNSWGKSTWTVSEKKKKGFDKSSKYATSGVAKNANLVKYRKLKVGEKYKFSVAVKMSGADMDWKANYIVKVFSGKKGDMHVYKEIKTKDTEQDAWHLHEITFTIKEGRENICFQVSRWAEGVTMHIDNFRLEKIK